MADNEWGNDSTKALKLRLVRSKQDRAFLSQAEHPLTSDFSPIFTYPIFGEEESIFGYRDLSIHLRFASGSLSQYLHVQSSAQYPATSGAVQPDDPAATLFEFIPPDYATTLDAFERAVEEDASAFKPVGRRVGAYRMTESSGKGVVNGKGKGKGKGKSTDDGTTMPPETRWEMLSEDDAGEEDEVLFEAFAADWATPGFKAYHRRMQIFVLLYIEGAQYIDEDDARWEFITLFERRKRADGTRAYHFVGYVSFYSFFCWPDTKRLRLAQFVVLPPYQGAGHGSALYTLSYQSILGRPEISELTVEDPSEPFEDMRDKCDLRTLLAGGDLASLAAPLARPTAELIRRKYKLADRQFYRLVEMIFLRDLSARGPAASAADHKAFRLMVKRRLYLFNKEMLLQIGLEERKEKLQETYEGVVEDYGRLLESFA